MPTKRKFSNLSIAMCCLLICGVPSADGQDIASGESGLPTIGKREKIRLFWCQWQHFGTGGVSDDELIPNLANVGATVMGDWGFNAERARLCHEHGIHYFSGYATARLRGPAEQQKTRLAVDKTGKTCLEQFAKYVADGGDPNKPWGSWGEGKGAYVPCPLDREPWDMAIINQVIELAKAGSIDGLQLDLEPYGAYKFDVPGEFLCYCDDCFENYRNHKQLANDPIKPAGRYGWLVQQNLLDEYLHHLRDRITEMFRSIATDIRAVRPQFGFSAYPDFVADDVRSDWRLQGMAVGLSSPDMPFIVVNSTPYWEDPTRPWWDGPAAAYRRMGIRHVMGSWDAGIMGHHNESHVGAAELMYEMAMASDGFWRWGEREYDTDDWRSFAMVNQRLRRVESKLGDFLFDGEDVPHFVSLSEETGNRYLDGALLTRTWQHDNRYLTRIFNGNTDWPIHVRIRFPRVEATSRWRVRDPIHDVEYLPKEGSVWTAAALQQGLVVPVGGRQEQFLVLEAAPKNLDIDRFRSVRTFAVTTHRTRPDLIKSIDSGEATFGENEILFERSAGGFYRGETAGQALVTDISMLKTDDNAARRLFGMQGYCRTPQFSADSKLVCFSAYVNGRGQIYLASAHENQTRNISNNEFCDRLPTFSPQTDKIVFVSDRDGDWEIYSMNVDGTEQRRLTSSPGIDEAPAVSPDGKQIAFISNRDGDLDVFLMNLDGSNVRRVVSRSGNEYEPTWSPDGDMLAFTVQRRQYRCVEIVKLGERQKQWFFGHGDATNMKSICFSSDGAQVAAAFSNYNQSGILTIDVRDPDRVLDEGDSRTKKIVEVDSWKPHDGNWYTTGTGTPRMVARTFCGVDFSPDGKRLVYCSDEQPSGAFMLHTIDLASGEVTPITQTQSAWPMNTDWSR